MIRLNTFGYWTDVTRKSVVVNTQSYHHRGMIVSERVGQRMKALGLSQAELARRVGVAQPTIYKLLNTNKVGSKYLHLIARELETTPTYLTGEIDDPDIGAIPPAPVSQTVHVMMPVALPTEQALSQMFEGLLEVVDRSAPVDELARELAQLLPTALSQLRGPLSYSPEVRPGKAEAVAAPATADLEDAR